jgi:hypothetical protein
VEENIMYRALYTYAWDLLDKSPAQTIAEFQDYGLNTLTLATSYHAGKFIRPHSADGKVYFPEDGTVYFRANMQAYGRLKPQINSLIQDQDVLADFCESAAIAVNGWTVLLHNTRLGMLHPDVSVSNAFGDRYYYSLCPSHPDVREYAIALCRDLTENYDISGLSLETPGFLPFEHGFHHEFAQVPQNPWLSTLLGLCFCEHCVRSAQNEDIDTATLQRQVTQWINAYLNSEVTVPADMAMAWLIGDLLADPDLSDFLCWRCDQVTSLVKEIKQTLRSDCKLAVIPSVRRPTSNAWIEGSDLPALAQIADALEIPCYEPNPERIASDIWDIRRRLDSEASAVELRAILRPGPPDMHSLEQVVNSIVALNDQDITDIAFYNYGMLRTVNLEWMRVALATLDDDLSGELE